MDVTTKFA
jgi:hypothetical protein